MIPDLIKLGGSGPAAILIHGFGADSNTWIGNTPALCEISSVWAVDVPGHGNAWKHGMPTSLTNYVDALATALDNTNIPAADLIGHSFGSAIATLLAIRHPEKVRSLVLLAPLGLGKGVSDTFLSSFSSLESAHEASINLQMCVFDKKLITLPVAEYVQQQLSRPGVQKTLQKLAKLIIINEPQIRTFYTKIKETNLPRLIIWGAQDAINPLCKDDRFLYSGEWQILDACGHLPHVEQRVQVNQLMTDFIRNLTASA